MDQSHECSASVRFCLLDLESPVNNNYGHDDDDDDDVSPVDGGS